MPEDSGAVAAAALAQPEVNVSAVSSSAPEPAGANFAESFAELEAAMGETPAVPKQEAAPKSPPSKPAVGADKKAPPASTSKTQSENARSAKDAPDHQSDPSTPGQDQNGKPLPAPELRKAYQELKTKYAAKDAELEALKKAPREDPQVKTLSEKLAAAEKHRQQLDEELRHSAYERSQEFKEKYHDPFVSAYQLGQETASQFKITDAEGNVRQGTADDFDTLMQIPDADTAAKWAEETYGPTKAAALLNHRQDVIKLARSRNAALQEAQKNAAEREKTRQEASQAQQKALAEKWTKLNTEAAEKYPNWFKEREGDEKWNELLKKGFDFADMAFNGHNLPPDKLVEVHSALRNRAAAFGPVAYRLKQSEARVAELEAELKAYQESEPKAGEGKGSERTEPGELDWEAQMEANWKT